MGRRGLPKGQRGVPRKGTWKRGSPPNTPRLTRAKCNGLRAPAPPVAVSGSPGVFRSLESETRAPGAGSAPTPGHPGPPWAPDRPRLSIFPPDTLRRKGPHKGAQEPPLWTKYVARCHGFCTGLYRCRVLFLAAIPSSGPLPCSGGPSPDLAWGPRVGIAGVVPGGPPRPSISLCRNQPSLSLFSGPHFPVTLLSNNFHVQFHFFSSSETSKLSARG